MTMERLPKLACDTLIFIAVVGLIPAFSYGIADAAFTLLHDPGSEPIALCAATPEGESSACED